MKQAKSRVMPLLDIECESGLYELLLREMNKPIVEEVTPIALFKGSTKRSATTNGRDRGRGGRS